MAEGRGRTAAEREAARRERANRRARREGRPEPYPEPLGESVAEPNGAAPTGAAESAAVPTEPRAAGGESAAVPTEPPAAGGEPAAVPTEPPATEAEPPAAAEPESPAAAEPEPPRRAPTRPIKSFPSPPDPDFYVPDDELETPSGTRRVSRGSRLGASRGRGGTVAPVRRSRGQRRRTHRSRAQRPAGPGRRWLGRFVAFVMLVAAAAVAWFAIELFQPFGVHPHGRVTVRIPQRMSSDAVGRLLAADGVIASQFFFEVRATLDGDRRDIRAGTYHLQRGMSYEAVLAKLTTAPKAAPTSEITIADGHTRQYVARLLHAQHIPGNYLAATRHSKLLDPRHYGAPKSTNTLEGFLFPDTFQLRDPIRISALVADQLKDFKRRFATIDLAGARRRHQSAFDVVIIASLLEGEAATPRDYRLVSSVIENRLRDHMMLGLDSTTRYATGNFTGPLTVSQLDSRSPYNTRNHYGLPPGPIDSPGLTALRAAADPAHSSYLYFFTKPCTNQMVYAKSYAQFQLLLVRDRRLHCPKRG
ncbi:MAG TPA: endolytic transglycosylase MltG [Solirubrobacteraceae bacterium]|nr:endolytic transglycosylase MltG [Solirubrobacteraceae bacterium]